MRDLKVYIVVALLALGIFLYIQYRKPAPVNWSQTYSRTDKIPYGTYILHHELSTLFEGVAVRSYRKRMYNILEELGNEADSYLIVAPELDIDEPDYQKLLAYVKSGNDLFIAAHTFGALMTDSLKLRIQNHFPWADSVNTVNFTNPELRSETGYRFDKRIAAGYFTEFDTLQTTVLATNGHGNAVFLRYPMGDGNLYILSSPDYFTNYALLSSEGVAFAGKALSYLTPQQQIIWDDFQAMGDRIQQSPLRVFLSDEHLRPAYLIALFSLLAFVIYGVKRRQRAIPIVEPLKNTSIEFAQVVSSVYYQRRDNLDLLTKEYRYFLEHVRTAYRVNTSNIDENFMQYLSMRSGVEKSILLNILRGMNDLQRYETIDDGTLLSHHRFLELFYQQALWKNNTSNNVLT
ncbi:DUF4350 domain-containing protein [Parapedobacter indicus]|uniref:DUF4350 domain-containing protein n=1 Tax=Parapedobacter indicus TaxID=1477437 RepID=A0A1I3NEZ6_9SPHI|nr:DUF4350 domain-containing protein [Parapedobacter indicus]PPL00970.1 uncharacterized protein DUF4350 [Parapedobacter indicus]SFJ07948.1 protein of unknown function [Parapedobacter indicus]